MRKKLIISSIFIVAFAGIAFAKKPEFLSFFSTLKNKVVTTITSSKSIAEKKDRGNSFGGRRRSPYDLPEIPGRDIRQRNDSLSKDGNSDPKDRPFFRRNVGIRNLSPQERKKELLERKQSFFSKNNGAILGRNPIIGKASTHSGDILPSPKAQDQNNNNYSESNRDDSSSLAATSSSSNDLTQPVEASPNRDEPLPNYLNEADPGLPVYDKNSQPSNQQQFGSFPQGQPAIDSESNENNDSIFGSNQESGSSSSGGGGGDGGGFFGGFSGFFNQTEDKNETTDQNDNDTNTSVSSGGAPPVIPQLPNTNQRSLNLNSYSLGFSSFCLVVENSLFCRGSNQLGELGLLVDQTEFSSLTKVSDFEGFTKSVSLGEYFTCVILLDKTGVCFGDDMMNKLSADSTGTLIDSQGNLLENLSSISLGTNSGCAITELGETYCWGLNDRGQLGLGSVDEDALGKMATKLNTNITFKKIRVYNDHACGLSNQDKLYCWGENKNGKLGINTLVSAPTPSPVVEIGDVLDFALGLDHTCAIKKEGNSGRIYCWGSNEFGQMLDYEEKGSKKPIMISTKRFKRLASSEQALCAVDEFEVGYCWGEVSFAGDGQISKSMNKYPMMDSVSSIEGFGFGFCFKSRDSLSCIGKNSNRMFGPTLVDFVLLPEKVNYNGLKP
jgi:hypothetical protein